MTFADISIISRTSQTKKRRLRDPAIIWKRAQLYGFSIREAPKAIEGLGREGPGKGV